MVREHGTTGRDDLTKERRVRLDLELLALERANLSAGADGAKAFPLEFEHPSAVGLHNILRGLGEATQQVLIGEGATGQVTHELRECRRRSLCAGRTASRRVRVWSRGGARIGRRTHMRNRLCGLLRDLDRKRSANTSRCHLVL